MTSNGNQFAVDFESPGDIAAIDPNGGLRTDLSCTSCAIQEASPDFPARSGTHVVVGRDFRVTVFDRQNVAWPSFGAYFTAPQPVFADFFRYDNDLQDFVLLETLQTPGGAPNEFLGRGFGATPDAPQLARVVFYSDGLFGMDDLLIGRPDGAIAIPEASTWALMILGFGIVGGGLRHRRRVSQAPNFGGCARQIAVTTART